MRAANVGRWRLRPSIRVYLIGVMLFLPIAPLLACARQATMLVVAALIGATTTAVDVYLLPVLPFDPVYAGAGLRVLGSIEPVGLALASPVGDVLHAAFPALFVPASLTAPGATVSALVEPGVTVLARLLAAIAATSVLVAATGLARKRLRSPTLNLSLTLTQIWLLLDLAHETDFGVRDLETTGLPFVLAAFAPVDARGQRVLATAQLESLPDVLVAGVSSIVAVAICVGLAMSIQATLASAHGILSRRRRKSAPVGEATCQSWPSRRLHLSRRTLARLGRLGALGAVALTLSVSPYAGIAEGETAAMPPGAPDDDPQTVTVNATEDSPPMLAAASITGGGDSTQSNEVAAPAVPSTAPAPRQAGSVVTLDGSNYQYVMRVNGKPTVVRGMGYNPWYADRGPEERRQLYRRDFSAMREIGVNTLEGWFQQQFDEVTLDEAQRQGLKVIMPFELNQDYDYGDPAIQAMFREQVTAWVLRYRDNPAVLMWGPGNEVMHRLIFPTVVQGQRDPGREKRADDFAAFYVQLIDMIRELDPNHPVVYRDAEDLYFARLRQSLTQDGVRRPWFIYGTNVYTQKLADVIERWPTQGVDAPLLVSEFSPGGVGTVDRPNMFSWYWSTIRAHPQRVLGGVVYTWTTRGPEDLDRVFGLTDEAGTPVDGSITALGQLFRGEPTSRRRSD